MDISPDVPLPELGVPQSASVAAGELVAVLELSKIWSCHRMD